jgi:hypothetical protein
MQQQIPSGDDNKKSKKSNGKQDRIGTNKEANMELGEARALSRRQER